MSTSVDEFCAAVARTASGTQSAKEETTHFVSQLADRDLQPTLGSPSSIRLRRILSEHKDYVLPHVRSAMSGVDLFGVSLPICNAFARYENKRRQIVVFDGLGDVIRCYAELANLLPLAAAALGDSKVQIGEEMHF